ncbi:MAG: hypothetical protein IPN81_08970 [Nitrosomonadales bacterium]|nr:hypothetical protein [Nitrosomonadales bacterium]
MRGNPISKIDPLGLDAIIRTAVLGALQQQRLIVGTYSYTQGVLVLRTQLSPGQGRSSVYAAVRSK